ncbi:MAG TPA: dTDP-4-dehydrorhamnose reductase [Terriglobales bacterium]|nr:dTDP-4-dehydrorhamnose reductase [Terriglobales bacterium]
MQPAAKIRVLLTGSTGQVGFKLLSRLDRLGEVFAPVRSQLDLAQAESIRYAIRSFQPHVIVNAAAYTAVDRAETQKYEAMQINGEAPRILAEEAKRHQAILVHYSTDYVFDGSRASPYTENEPTSPVNQYGKSKLAGEKNILRIGGAHFILRTSWVYAPRGSNFLLKMLQLGGQRESLRVVSDQIGTPTPASVVADATLAVLQHCTSFQHARNLSGIYHATCRGETSWFEFARTIFFQARQNRVAGLRVREVFPISTAEYPTPCQRPKYSVLCCRKIRETFSFHAPEWQQALATVIRKLHQK